MWVEQDMPSEFNGVQIICSDFGFCLKEIESLEGLSRGMTRSDLHFNRTTLAAMLRIIKS